MQAALGSGIPSSNIKLSDAGNGASGDQQPHAWDWLFSSPHISERDRAYYRAHAAEGRTALSVMMDDGGASPRRAEAVEAILGRFKPIDVRREQGAALAEARTSVPAASSERLEAEAEQVIPLLREDLRVGVKAADRVRHIRTYVVEEPIEREVSLADEQWIIEKRPATRKVAAGTTEPVGREYELYERHEEPVVEKTLLADEELVVRKEPRRHTEQVRGTVRRTRVDIEKDSVAATTQGLSPARPASSSTLSAPSVSMKPRDPGVR